MRIDEFRRILQEFSRQARKGTVLTETAQSNNAADLAEKLNEALGKVVSQFEI